MNRVISTERVYHLGEYKSLRLVSAANDIPEELAMNSEFTDKMRLLQLLEIEKAYYGYSVLAQGMRQHSTDGERLEALTELVEDTFEKLLELYKDTLNKE